MFVTQKVVSDVIDNLLIDDSLKAFGNNIKRADRLILLKTEQTVNHFCRLEKDFSFRRQLNNFCQKYSPRFYLNSLMVKVLIILEASTVVIEISVCQL